LTASSVRPLVVCFPTSSSLGERRSETSSKVSGKGSSSRYWWRELCGVSIPEAVDYCGLWTMRAHAFSLSAASSPVAASADTLWSIADLEISLQALRWYERVPTVSNLADDPSRLCLRMSQHLALLSRMPTAVRRLSGLPVQSWPTRECPIERHQVRSECASRCITWLRDLRRCVPRHASQVRCCFKYGVRIRATVT
jgi:hypothetical protein